MPGRNATQTSPEKINARPERNPNKPDTNQCKAANAAQTSANKSTQGPSPYPNKPAKINARPERNPNEREQKSMLGLNATQTCRNKAVAQNPFWPKLIRRNAYGQERCRKLVLHFFEALSLRSEGSPSPHATARPETGSAAVASGG